VTDDQLAAVLAERVLGWAIGPDRFLLGGRRWAPRWRFKPATRLEDAFRLLESVAAEEFTMGTADSGGFWAKVRIAGGSGEALDPSKPRAITIAIARALGITVNSSE
jgi:hypothetical protein